MTKFYKSFENLPKANMVEESNADIFNAQAVVYLTLNKGHMKYSVLDLGGIEMSIMLAAKDHGVDSIPAYSTNMYPYCFKKKYEDI